MKNFLLSLAVAACTCACAADDFAFTYRGRINPIGISMPGTVDVTFSLYAESAGGDALWTGVVNGVRPSTNGFFQCQLAGEGLAEAMTARGARFIGVKIGGGDEQHPRQEILVAPLASRAQVAGALTSDGSVGRIETSQIDVQSISLGKTTVSEKLSSGDKANALTIDNISFASDVGASLTLKAGGGIRVFRDAMPLSKRFDSVAVSTTTLFSASENQTGGAVVLRSYYKRDFSYQDGAACITWIVGPGEIKPLYNVGHPVYVYFYPFGTAN